MTETPHGEPQDASPDPWAHPGEGAQPEQPTGQGGAFGQQNPYGQQQGQPLPSYGQQQDPYQQSPYQQQQQPGQAAPGQPPYGEQPYGQQPYGLPQYGQPGQGQQGQQAYGPSGYPAAPPLGAQQGPYGYGAQAFGTGTMPPLAEWGQRARAFVLDNGIFIIGNLGDYFARHGSAPTIFSLITLVGLIFAIYNAVRAGRTGQSHGMQSAGIRLARFQDGQPIGGWLSFVRIFFHWLFFTLFVIPGVLNYLWPLWDSKSQTWSDKIVSSVVVKAA